MNIDKNIYLLLGTNLGQRKYNLQKAIALLEERFETSVQQSSLFETAAWGKTNQPGFLNQAIGLKTRKTPFDTLNIINQVEGELGRERFEKWGPRLIDIDILFFNNEIVNTKELQIPHAEVQNRRFALVPMLELAPDFIHPVLELSISQLLNQCSDNLEVKKVS